MNLKQIGFHFLPAQHTRYIIFLQSHICLRVSGFSLKDRDQEETLTRTKGGLAMNGPNQEPGIVWEGSPIKRPSVKENTSPGEETNIVALLRYDGVAYSPRQSLFFAFACMFLRRRRWICPADLHRTGHSPLPVTAMKPLMSLSPGGHVAPTLICR